MNHIHPITTKVSRPDREDLLRQRAMAIWFTGLSGSGKSTLATELEGRLSKLGFKTYLLDGDNIRTGLNADLGFTGDDRKENIRRIGEVAKLFVDAGLVVISAFISPFASDRQQVKQLVGDSSYLEVFADCPIEICEKRDVKGLYAKAKSGLIRNFTGIDSPYEKPAHPDIRIETDKLSVDEAMNQLLELVIPLITLK